MEYQNFKLEIDEQGIAVFTANRPEKMNALNDLSWAEMNQFFTWADKADEVKVIIVTGAGEKAFIISVLYQKMHYLHFLKQDWDFYREPAEPRDLQD